MATQRDKPHRPRRPAEPAGGAAATNQETAVRRGYGATGLGHLGRRHQHLAAQAPACVPAAQNLALMPTQSSRPAKTSRRLPGQARATGAGDDHAAPSGSA
jgi:hypothetical protein